MKSSPEHALADRLLSDIWDEQRARTYAFLQSSILMSAVPDLSLEAARKRADSASGCSSAWPPSWRPTCRSTRCRRCASPAIA